MTTIDKRILRAEEIRNLILKHEEPITIHTIMHMLIVSHISEKILEGHDPKFVKKTFLRSFINTINKAIEIYNDQKSETIMKGRLKLSPETITEIFEKGFSYVKLPDGTQVAVRKEDLVFDKEEVEKLLQEQKTNRDKHD